jgi:protocatechuate 3,4-dioxygenase beta subunit
MTDTMGRAQRASATPNEAGAVHRTPGLLLGPYYPVARSGGGGRDLWRDGVSPPPAVARRLRFEGQAIDRRGNPTEGALVEIWHADPDGRYPHPSAPDHEQVAPGFAGYGRTQCDAQGRFVFRSLVPGGYVAKDVRRAPHVHVQVTGRSDRLVTQLFLPRHPLNAQDRWYRAVERPELLVPDVVRDDADALVLGWTIVLAQG